MSTPADKCWDLYISLSNVQGEILVKLRRVACQTLSADRTRPQRNTDWAQQANHHLPLAQNIQNKKQLAINSRAFFSYVWIDDLNAVIFSKQIGGTDSEIMFNKSLSQCFSRNLNEKSKKNAHKEVQ